MQLSTFLISDLLIIVFGIIITVFIAFLLMGIRIIKMHEIVFILRSEKRLLIKGPGIIFIVPLIDKIIAKVDLKNVIASFLAEEKTNLSKKLSVLIRCGIHYRIASSSDRDIDVVETTLKMIVDESYIDKLIFKKDKFASVLQNTLNQSVSKWNVEITRVDVDIEKINHE